jgi:membrane protease YdiL (CAAX protease family)
MDCRITEMTPFLRAVCGRRGGPAGPNPAAPMKLVLPGLSVIVAIDLLAVFDRWRVIPGGDVAHTLILLATPWLALLIAGRSPAAFGYHRHRLLLNLGWGAVAGGAWRLASLLLNIIALGSSLQAERWWMWISAILWVPFLEETFFRGYLGRSLAALVGIWPGMIIQAVVFTFQPYHLGQGWPGLVGVFGFGLLAGWLMHRRGSIWAAWGAHAFANALVLPLVPFA